MAEPEEGKMASTRPEILFLTENEAAVSDLLDFFDRHGCHCTVGTLSTAAELVHSHAFQFVVSVIPLRQEDPFVLSLSGTDTRIFYRLSVEDGCWWVPLDGEVRKSLGGPALRSGDFTDYLEKALEQLKAHEPAAENHAAEQNKPDRGSVRVAAGGDL